MAAMICAFLATASRKLSIFYPWQEDCGTRTVEPIQALLTLILPPRSSGCAGYIGPRIGSAADTRLCLVPCVYHTYSVPRSLEAATVRHGILTFRRAALPQSLDRHLETFGVLFPGRS